MDAVLIHRIACDDPDAIAFIRMIDFVADVWDDLIDQDQPINDRRTCDAFWTTLVEMPRNGFYREHFDQLNALIAVAIMNWELATKREREGGADSVSFVLRSAFVDIFVMVALIKGGYEHATIIANELRGLAHAEGLNGYNHALEAERKVREG